MNDNDLRAYVRTIVDEVDEYIEEAYKRGDPQNKQEVLGIMTYLTLILELRSQIAAALWLEQLGYN